MSVFAQYYAVKIFSRTLAFALPTQTVRLAIGRLLVRVPLRPTLLALKHPIIHQYVNNYNLPRGISCHPLAMHCKFVVCLNRKCYRTQH